MADVAAGTDPLNVASAPPAVHAYGATGGLRQRAVTGIAWTAGSRVIQQLLSLAVTTALARLLVPSDFGLVALVLVFTSFAAVLAEFGLGAALIQRPEVEERHLSSTFWLNAALGVVLAVGLTALAPAIEAFYGDPRLFWITVATALTLLVTPLAVVQTALVQRAMDFRRLALVENAAMLSGGALAIGTAAAGLGVWSLVLMGGTSAATRVAFLWILSDWRPRARFSRDAVRELWSFSANLLGFQALNYWIRNADNLMVGKFVGAAALGIYGRAYNLMLQPIGQVSVVAARVMVPALAHLQGEPERVRKAYLRAIGLIALIAFPACVGLLVAAEPLVLSLYGATWKGVVPILQLLSVAALVQSVSTTVGWIYQSQGRTDWMFRWGLVAGVVTIGSFAVGVRWGTTGVALAYAIRTLVLAPFTFLIPGRLIGLRLGHVARSVAPALVAAAGMGATVLGISWATRDVLPMWASLLVDVGVGAAAYTALLLALRPPALAELRALVAERGARPPEWLRPHAGAADDRKPLNVLVSNCVCLNGGDAAILEATVAGLASTVQGEIAVTVLDRQPESAARLLPSYAVAPWPWQVFFPSRRSRVGRATRRLTAARAYGGAYLMGRRAAPLARPLLRRREWALLRRILRADVVVAKGGTYLVETYHLEPHLFDFRLCLLLRRPLVLGAQSLGPFSSKRSCRALRRVIPRVRLVLLRDERSLAHLRALGIDTSNAAVVADAAFALADASTLEAARYRTLADPLRAALSVREWPHFRTVDPAVGRERYVEAICGLATRIVRVHGASLTFLSTCQGVPEYWTDDSRIARDIVARLPDDVAAATRVDAEYHSTDELRALIASFDVCVATRMHFGILALTEGVPVLPIAYELKTIDLYRRLGFDDLTLDIETITPEGARAALDTFLATLPERRAGLFEGVDRERRAALAGAELMAGVVSSQPRLPAGEHASAGAARSSG